MEEMKEHTKEEMKQEKAKNSIQSEPGVSMSIKPAKFISKTEAESKPKQSQDNIKLFDFGATEIKESFVNNVEKDEPLEGTKFYMNVVHSDKVLPPLNKDRDFADKNNDSTWQVIPVAFTPPFETRKNVSGTDCIHYDAHVNTCVVEHMKRGKRNF